MTTSCSDSSLATYLSDIRGVPPLTPGEERRLARRAAAGDTAARQRLVEANLRYVVAIARGYAGLGLDLSDLVQEGNLGLLAAARTFDPERGVAFAGHARWSIKQAICRALSAKSRTIRTLGDRLGDDETVDPAARVCEDEARTMVRRAVADLDDRWKQVLVLRLGLVDDRLRSLAEVAAAIGVSRARVREIETRAMCRLAAEPRLQALRAA